MNQLRRKLDETPLNKSKIIVPDLMRAESSRSLRFLEKVLRKAGESVFAASIHQYYLKKRENEKNQGIRNKDVNRTWEHLIEPEELETLRTKIEAVKRVTNAAGES